MSGSRGPGVSMESGWSRAARVAAVALVLGLAGETALLAQPRPGPTPAPAPTTGAAPAGPRDPFDPLVKRPAPGTTEQRAQEIAGLKLVGIIWEPAVREQIRALVETPDGLGYYLRVNEEKFGGTVVAIDRDRVQFSVREQVPGGAGRVRTVELKLAKQDAQQ